MDVFQDGNYASLTLLKVPFVLDTRQREPLPDHLGRRNKSELLLAMNTKMFLDVAAESLWITTLYLYPRFLPFELKLFIPACTISIISRRTMPEISTHNLRSNLTTTTVKSFTFLSRVVIQRSESLQQQGALRGWKK